MYSVAFKIQRELTIVK